MTTIEKTADAPERKGPDAGPLLEVRDLHVEFHTRDGVAKAVNGVNYSVSAGETLAVLGESGSGKSVTAQAIMGILDMPPAKIPKGEILFRGQDMLKMSAEERRKLRGAKIAMIFQDALSSLNPVLSVGYQLGEMFRIHQGLSKKDAKAKAIELMDRVRIPAAKDRVGDYPHQFSGGMRQRIMIAMALALEPDLIIADEPTTALDVTVQAQVMDLLAELQREFNMGLILITHDLGVVADVADKIAVMYAGRIVETAPVHELYKRPAHPYTRGLLDSIPRLDQKGQELYAIKGLPPNLLHIPAGCAFSPRCPKAQDICRTEIPALHDVAEADGAALPGRRSACHFWKETIHG
ncbi:ABC transporter ATP-binding protein [Streptomyces mobaraensis NBRC 13819 = DSM 40847]|uniref:Oligopeptide/dipeptide ABC transporter ATPase n=1 Tax=Streptomyces mobaraensis (strain ATCC 29032 / DSM 40847 / JCM 4168 / NBRC 13819 / NCIMB 11159 / IPCR 16-22) TaxID=1223523 RepID=M3B4T1_STRM1|nr:MULTISPECIES: ABC transporter ATP-binding protein [Streptomyces]EMF00998.1 oligopeptide/dipeptide ABC transporter ATPase [Streptomyces mobaraensis NBRC 13819 = DSM 40847]MBC2875177.1 ABC transporter ATP-binding protein [Streptomyces sp. TYQ1024]QTT75510.1 ABC transporter ATP-binding protein [Streptomyces mobaraensis NBRC 13819 = DSM 40847]UBI37009.1 ABC transporter ATP-binding protein [Streptomyces mobaraensis]UKW29602.1 ABC transporter ATP-binding protein [Streptomyces sp. TYQ1024]